MFVLHGNFFVAGACELFVFLQVFLVQISFFSTDPCQKVFCPATEQRRNNPCQKGYPTRVALDKTGMGGQGGGKKEEKEKE